MSYEHWNKSEMKRQARRVLKPDTLAMNAIVGFVAGALAGVVIGGIASIGIWLLS